MPRIIVDHRTDEEIARERRIAINAMLSRRMDRLAHALEGAELGARRLRRTLSRFASAADCKRQD